MDKLFWNGKKVFITGHTGFKGSWLTSWLKHLGAYVCGYSLEPPSNPNNFTVSSVNDNMQSVIGDIRDREYLFEIVNIFKPDIVFHLAAQPLVRESYLNPLYTYEVNVIGTLNLLDSLRNIQSVKSIVNVTTDKCYENKEWDWPYRENDALGGHDPYSSSKGCSELLTSAFRRSYNLPVATARAGNVIGGGDWANDRLLPDILKAVQNNEHLTIRYPDAVRPWQHVLEPLAGYIKLARLLYDDKKYADSWNFGPNEDGCKSVRYILDFMQSKLYPNLQWNIDDSETLHEATLLKLDISKSQNKLNWRPQWSLQQALEATAEWHNYWLQNKDMEIITVNQIKKYMNGEKNV